MANKQAILLINVFPDSPTVLQFLPHCCCQYFEAVFSLEIANQVVLVNALYGLGQLLIGLDCTMNIIIAIQTKWCKRFSWN